jgi:hypothetical protein
MKELKTLWEFKKAISCKRKVCIQFVKLVKKSEDRNVKKAVFTFVPRLDEPEGFFNSDVFVTEFHKDGKVTKKPYGDCFFFEPNFQTYKLYLLNDEDVMGIEKEELAMLL